MDSDAVNSGERKVPFNICRNKCYIVFAYELEILSNMKIMKFELTKLWYRCTQITIGSLFFSEKIGVINIASWTVRLVWIMAPQDTTGEKIKTLFQV